MDNIVVFEAAKHSSNFLTYFGGLFSGAMLSIFGGYLTYKFQRKSKMDEIENKAKENLRYINFLLCSQRSNLANLQKILEGFDLENKRHRKVQRFYFTPINFLITDRHIQEISNYQLFVNNSNHVRVVQLIITSDSLYKKCSDLVDEYNDHLSNENLIAPKDLYHLSVFSAGVLQDAISKTLEEAIVTNKKARESIVDIYGELFGHEEKLPTVDNEIIEAKDL